MTVGIITQLGVQGVVSATPNARVTQQGVKTAVQQNPQAVLTQYGVQALVKTKPAPGDNKARLFQTSTTSSPGVAGDPHYRKVTLLLQADKGFRDLSKYNDYGLSDRFWVTYSTSVVKFTKSFHCPSALNYGIRFYKNPERWGFGGGPFTIEGWIHPTSSTGNRGIMGSWMPGSQRGWVLYRNSGVLTFTASRDGTDTNTFTLVGPNVPNNAWAHICVERDTIGMLRMYVNGVMVASASFPDAIYNTQQPCMVLTYAYYSISTGSYYSFQGYADDFRITKGVARYATDISFPLSASPAPYSAESVAGDITSDPHWDKVTCLLNPNAGGSPVDLKRGATITGMTYASGQISNDGGTIAHVDGQWDIGGRTEPFTLELDFGWNSSGGNGTSQFVCPGGWIINSGTSDITFYYWNGTGWTAAASWSNMVGGRYYPHGSETTVITRDESGVFRCYQMGVLKAKFQSNKFPATPTADLQVNGGSGRDIRCIRMTWGVARYTEEDYIQSTIHDATPPTTGPVWVAPTLPTATYPYDLGFPDPADGVGTWTNNTGANPTAVNKHATRVYDTEEPDDHWRWSSGAATYVRNSTALDIPTQYHATIDAGGVFLEYNGFGASSLVQGDAGALWAVALDRAGEPLRHGMSNAINSKTFQPVDGILPLPPGTRRVRVGFLTYRAGSASSFIFRKVEARLINATAENRVYLAKPANAVAGLMAANTADWVDSKGGSVVNTTVSNWSIASPTTTGKSMDLRCVENLPATLFTQIDAGEVAFNYKTLLSQLDTNDIGRIYVEFLDAADTLVGRRKYDIACPYVVGTLHQTEVAVPIPATARKVVMGVIGSMDYAEVVNGTNVSSFFTGIHEAYCYIPAPGDMPAAAPTPPTLTADEHWESVVLLLTTRNGAIENLAEWDMRRMTITGAVTVETINSPFGTTAIGCNLAAVAANNDYIELELYGPDFGPKMTFEGWFRKSNHTARAWACIHNQLTNGADSAGSPMRLDGTAKSDAQMIFGDWYHVALCRDDTGRGVVFINGKKQVTESTAYATLWNRLFRLFYCTNAADQASWVGYADEIRLTHGVERYTTDFIPPANRFPTTLGPTPLHLTGEVGNLLLSGDTGSILLNGV